MLYAGQLKREWKSSKVQNRPIHTCEKTYLVVPDQSIELDLSLPRKRNLSSRRGEKGLPDVISIHEITCLN